MEKYRRLNLPKPHNFQKYYWYILARTFRTSHLKSQYSSGWTIKLGVVILSSQTFHEQNKSVSIIQVVLPNAETLMHVRAGINQKRTKNLLIQYFLYQQRI